MISQRAGLRAQLLVFAEVNSDCRSGFEPDRHFRLADEVAGQRRF
jgi:hypothetical protein